MYAHHMYARVRLPHLCQSRQRHVRHADDATQRVVTGRVVKHDKLHLARAKALLEVRGAGWQDRAGRDVAPAGLAS